MSAQALINAIERNPARLKALIKIRKDHSFTTIMDEVKKLGLKPFEFYWICKWVEAPELLYNQLATLELIADNLLDENIPN